MSSRSLNRVTLIGNLTRDSELKYTPQGTAVCSFSVATNRSWVTATGELKEDVQYHRIVAWQKLAELCDKILAKGKKVYLEGRITYRSYTGRDGVQRSITEIILDDFVLLDSSRRQIDNTSQKDTKLKDESTVATLSENTQTTETVTHEIKKDTVNPDKIGVSDINDNNEEKIEPDDIPF